ncbi:MAG: phosphate signaling complex protein PhoU [Thermodesulfobacteriota bacterium]|nr:phosphate signaling complex protein PhoU [Thermodesulfobacteriota bacterium]
MTRHFHHEIEKLQQKLLTMGSMVEDRVSKACSVIESEDVEIAKKIIKTDWEIDTMEMEIEEECLKIMALYQPVAKDLRFLVTVIKINSEMERIGDYAALIAKRVRRISKVSSPSFSFNFKEMTEKVISELKMSLDALVDRNIEMAKQIFILDQEVDALRSKSYKMILKEMKSNPEHITSLLNFYLVTRHLERIADRATNIAEDVIYMVDGEIVRKNLDLDK